MWSVAALGVKKSKSRGVLESHHGHLHHDVHEIVEILDNSYLKVKLKVFFGNVSITLARNVCKLVKKSEIACILDFMELCHID